MRFNDKLKALREEKRLSQDELGKSVGASGPTIHRWETNPDTFQALVKALRLARALGVTLDYLADDDLDEPPDAPLTDDDRAVLDLYHALELNKSEALRRLAGKVSESARATEDRPVQAYEWVRPQRTETEADQRRERERLAPKKVEKKNSGVEKKK